MSRQNRQNAEPEKHSAFLLLLGLWLEGEWAGTASDLAEAIAETFPADTLSIPRPHSMTIVLVDAVEEINALGWQFDLRRTASARLIRFTRAAIAGAAQPAIA